MIPFTRFSLFALLLSVAALTAPSAQAMVPGPSASNATFAGAPGSDVDARLDRITRALQQLEGGAPAFSEGDHGQDLVSGFVNGAGRGFPMGPIARVTGAQPVEVSSTAMAITVVEPAS